MTSCWSATTRCARRSASSRCAHPWSPSLPAPWRRRRCCRDASHCPPARGSAWCSPAATSIPTSSATSCAAEGVPNFLRECVAREGQEDALRDDLVAAHERFARAMPHLVEVLLYREHFMSRRFLSFVRHDSERAVASLDRGVMLYALSAVGRARCGWPGDLRPRVVLAELACVLLRSQ